MRMSTNHSANSLKTHTNVHLTLPTIINKVTLYEHNVHNNRHHGRKLKNKRAKKKILQKNSNIGIHLAVDNVKTEEYFTE